MEIINKKLAELKPYENNPRNNDEAVETVANSIKEFGFKNPIIIDKDNVIVCGHTRYKAAEKLGFEDAPCIMADDLTEEQIKAFRLADNKTAELASWDFDLLDTELDSILDIDMADFGFEDINVDDFGDTFELPEGDKNPICQMTFTLHEKQKELVEYVCGLVADNVSETFGNTNKNGNALYEVFREWAERRK